MATTSDRIEKQFVVQAPLDRVWRAVSVPADFGLWFGVKLEGAFTPGARVKGRISSPGYEHLTMEIEVVEVVARRKLSFRWHPYAIDPKVDYSKEPTTLVEIGLEETKGATRVTFVESGFDKIPAARRAEAHRANDGGWTIQSENLARHVAAH